MYKALRISQQFIPFLVYVTIHPTYSVKLRLQSFLTVTSYLIVLFTTIPTINCEYYNIYKPKNQKTCSICIHYNFPHLGSSYPYSAVLLASSLGVS
nr:MAG TPA: hypothetical protein [Bacteriophage sp.]